MDNFNTSADLPFSLHGGDGIETARYNRIAAINRINYLVKQTLPDFSLHEKSADYLHSLDLALFEQFYSEEPNKVIDEEFCQNAAKVCLELEKTKEFSGYLTETPKLDISNEEFKKLENLIIDKEKINKEYEKTKSPMGDFLNGLIKRVFGK